MNNIYLCKPQGIIISQLEIDAESASITESVSDTWELSFQIHRYIYNDGERVSNPHYNSISEMMELYLDSELCKARFIIDTEPQIVADGVNEIKTVTAHSIEQELQYKMLVDFQINTGQSQSQENLVKGNLLGKPVDPNDYLQTLYDYNLNPYTNLPIDYITVCCKLGEDLQAFLDDGVTEHSITWTFDNTEFEHYGETITFDIEFNAENGVISSTQSDLLDEWFKEFIKRFPRIISDLTWGYDRREDSKTFNTIICVTDIYISRSDDGTIYIPQPTYRYELNQTEDAYDIFEAHQTGYDFQRFLDGMTKLIGFYDDFSNQFGMLDLILEKTKAASWSVGEVSDSIARKKFSFTVDNQDIYSFLMNTVARTMKVIVDFDRVNKTVCLIDLSIADTKYETGITTGFHNLLQSLNINTATTDGIKTTFKPMGANNLGVSYVNFGKDQITNLDYFINKVDEYGDYQYGSETLYEKYNNWKNYRDKDMGAEIVVSGYDFNLNKKTINPKEIVLSGKTRRQQYIELSKLYNQTLKDINDLTYLVPSDGAMTDYTTFTLKDLLTVAKAYTNAFNALVEIFKAEFPDKNIEDKDDVADTYLYQDYILYSTTIIPNIQNALKIYALTNAEGKFIDEEGHEVTRLDNLIFPAGGNPQYNGNAKLVTEAKYDGFLYDMSLYGLSELTIKKNAWAASAAKIYKDAFVKSGTPGKDAVYRTWAEVAANPALSEGFVGETNYNTQLNEYLDYMSTTARQNSLTKEKTVGVVVLASQAIDDCEEALAIMETAQAEVNEWRTILANSVSYEGWGEFTDQELAILYSLSHEADYSNDNILVTNLDDVVTTVDTQEELYQDAQKKLFEKSRPQYAFETTLDNILALEDFVPLKSQLKLLNYVYLRYGLYDDETIKLRIVQMTFNPVIKTEDFSLGFSNMTYTYDGISDFFYLFEDGSGVSSSGSSSGSGGGGTYGATNAEIELSNNMLSALLKNNMTGGELNITEKVTARDIEGLIHNGDLVIDGAAITDIVKSKNYNGIKTEGVYPIDNTEGSILRLNDGSFNFGGSALIFDRTVNPPTLIMNGGTIVGGQIRASNNRTWINLLDGSFNFNDQFTYNGKMLQGRFELNSVYFHYKSERPTQMGDGRELIIDTGTGIICGVYPEQYSTNGIQLRTLDYSGAPAYATIFADPSCYIRPNGIEIVNNNIRILYNDTGIYKQRYNSTTEVWDTIQTYLSY